MLLRLQSRVETPGSRVDRSPSSPGGGTRARARARASRWPRAAPTSPSPSARAARAPRRRRTRSGASGAGSCRGPADARRPGQIAGFVDGRRGALGGRGRAREQRRASSGESTLEELTEEALDEAFDVNVKAAVLASRAAAPHMRRRGRRLDRERGQPRRPAALEGLPAPTARPRRRSSWPRAAWPWPWPRRSA